MKPLFVISALTLTVAAITLATYAETEKHDSSYVTQYIVVATMTHGDFVGDVHLHDIVSTESECEFAARTIKHAYYEGIAETKCHAIAINLDSLKGN